MISGTFDVDGGEVFLECLGTGSPTVIVETGLDTPSAPWADVIGELAGTTRACRYDRPGIGYSDWRPGETELTAGDRARDLHALLDVAGVEGPYVLVGWSYGGMLIRSFTASYPDEAAGLVFVDASHEDQFAPGSWWMGLQSEWRDGAYLVDLAGTREELGAAGDLGARPMIVLTQGRMNGRLEREWSPLQDAIAALSSASRHMVAAEAGHDIRGDQPELLVASIRAVVEAVRGTALPACDAAFAQLGAECLEGTMGDLIAAWDARRDAVIPAVGDLPEGRFRFEEGDRAVTIRLRDGRLQAAIRHADGTSESFSATYAADGDRVTFVWPFDLRIPRTPGINVATWTADADGTLRFEQVDDEPVESWLAIPWVPVTRE